MQLAGTHSLVASTLIVSAIACASTPPTAVTPSRPATQIAQADVEAAQRSWCAALIEIGHQGATGGNAKATATNVFIQGVRLRCRHRPVQADPDVRSADLPHDEAGCARVLRRRRF